MNPFRVWIGPLGDFCRVRVEGIKNAHWLLARLSQEFVFKTIEPIRQKKYSPCCHFNVAYNAILPPVKFERLLAAIPPVQLLMELPDKTESYAG